MHVREIGGYLLFGESPGSDIAGFVGWLVHPWFSQAGRLTGFGTLSSACLLTAS
jgi:hypothetical protein